MRRLAVAAVVLTLASAACIREAVPEAVPAPPSKPPVDDYGLSGRTCGTVALDHGAAGIPASARECIEAAAQAGTAAHLVVTRWTIEGDPIFRAYQIVGPERVDVVYDARWDGFGSGRMTRSACRHVPGDAGPELTLADCTEPA